MNLPRLPIFSRFLLTCALILTIFCSLSYGGEVTLAWDASADSSVVGYKIYRGTSTGIYDYEKDFGDVTTAVVTGLDPGQEYYFSATGYNSYGDESTFCNEVKVSVPPIDTDNDGISDSDELNVYGTDPNNPDSDGDGLTDGFEISTGGDPSSYDPAPGQSQPPPFDDNQPSDNSTPEAQDDMYNITSDIELVVPSSEGVLANDYDPDGEPLIAVLVGGSGPSSGSLMLSADGSLIYSPHTGFSGTDSFSYYAEDPSGNKEIATVTIKVAPPIDSAPAATNDTETHPFSYAAGTDPAGWLDTGANNSMVANDSLFKTYDVGGEMTFGTTSTLSDIHSHYTAAIYDADAGFVFTGRMRMSASNSGIGVTSLSDYPNSDTYYRLRRYHNNAFHLAPHPHGTVQLSGDTDSGIIPEVNSWYRFKIELTDTGSRTEIKAKVWGDGTAEPAGWQIDAWDSSSSRLTTGKIGLWSYSSGSKYWDDIKVEMRAPANQTPVPPEPTSEPDLPASIVGHPTNQSVTEGDAVTFTVSAAGTEPLNYQWQRRNGTVWVDIAGATGSSYTAAETVFPDDNGAYFRCKVSNTVAPAGVYSNQATLTVAVTVSEAGQSADYSDNFGSYAAGSDPAGWLDTGANNSMNANDSLFKTYDVGGEIAFGTTSTLSDIHSHYSVTTYDAAAGFVFTGRMLMSVASGGIGVTFLSDYPNSDTYYRLRRFSSNAFHLAPHPHGTVTLYGDTDSGVTPAANTWYSFMIQVQENTGVSPSRTEIKAKVWEYGTAEPADWQIDAWNESAGRLTSGKIGLWGYASGSKYWDDIAVEVMAPVNQTPVANCTINPLAGPVPLLISFDGSTSDDPDGTIESYAWDFGDGDTADTMSGQHTYDTAGEYTVVLTVTDNEGAIGKTEATVTVSEPGQPASIVSHPADQSVTEGQAATFTVVAEGTEPLSYQWQRQNGAGWDDIAGAPGSSYTIDETVFPGEDGASFRCFVSNAVNPTGEYSDAATLTVAVTVSEAGQSADYLDNFGSYGAGTDPAGWLDTRAKNSMVENDSLFKTYEVGGEMTFGTTSTLSNIHSHYESATYDAAVGYIFTGRMRMSASRSGIGVTFLSDYPNSDTYYRLRRYNNNSFHLAPHPHGTVKLSGDTDSGVTPAVNTWYWFKVQVQDTGRTEIKAKVWADGTAEPAGWQIDAWDESATRLTTGKIGVWSYSSGSKYWDDLTVTLLAP